MGCACGILVSSLAQELTGWAPHPQWDWASPISGEKEVDPRISDFPAKTMVIHWTPMNLGISSLEWQVGTHRDKCRIKYKLDS